MQMRWIAFVCACAMTMAFAAQTDATARGARGKLFPQTKNNIHLEMVFNYRLKPEQLKRETGGVDLVWGSSYASLPEGMYNSAYIPYSVDNFLHDVAWYQTNHPDWLEYLCDRKTLAFEFGTTSLAPLDVANPDVRAYQWSNWVDAPLAAGYQGIAVDTMALYNSWKRCGHYDSGGNWVQQYSGDGVDPAFRHDVLDWETATYSHVHALSKTATMQVNVTYDFGAPRGDNRKLMSTADLLFDERGFTNWGGTDRHVTTPEEWTTIVRELQYVQSKGLCYQINGEEPSLTKNIPQADRLWVIGNYLLVKNDCSYMYMSGFQKGGGQDYGRLIVFPEYKIRIGRPVSAMEQKQGAWQRLYSNGLTLVNPNNATAIVDLPDGNWVDVNGDVVSSPVTLTPQTAQVLLKK